MMNKQKRKGGLYTFIETFHKYPIFEKFKKKIKLYFAGSSVCFGDGVAQIIRLDGVHEHNFFPLNKVIKKNVIQFFNDVLLNRKLLLNLKKSEYIIYQSEYSKNTFEKRYRRFVVNKKSTVIRNGSDIEVGNSLVKNHERPEVIRIFTSSVAYPIKKIEHNFALLGKLKKSGIEFHYTIAIGSPGWAHKLLSDKLNIDNLIEKNGLDGSYIKVIKNASKSEIRNELYNCDVYITFSDKDPCPNSVVEALAMGVPVIGPNSGGVKELIDPRLAFDVGELPEYQNIFRTQPINDNAVNNCYANLSFLMKNYAEIKKKHLQCASQWNEKRMFEEYINFIESVINECD